MYKKINIWMCVPEQKYIWLHQYGLMTTICANLWAVKLTDDKNSYNVTWQGLSKDSLMVISCNYKSNDVNSL